MTPTPPPASPAIPRRRRVLVCGFGPFPGMPSNPSSRLATALGRLARPALGDVEVVVRLLPTTWEAVAEAPALLDEVQPDAILLLGVAGRRRQVCVETLAFNRAADAPDALRRHPPARALAAGAPARLTTTAHPGRLLHALRKVPARLSRDAGRYLCNAVYFRMLLALRDKSVPLVFVHIPGAPRLGVAAYDAALASAVGNLMVALAAQMPWGATRGARP
ncbi:peptidase C15 [Azorhizobium oxalatiphilum]|uniref:Pyroglutamyl-peptidase I n=1 Tax=Azorhizobium oxalatiphilum TaxID=980631 RepID=A0A917FE87_9HYPH|nr:peptidase C15 [Azorhizobium oxalatiphilum]GGF73050.1 peptidase C15 [Azorhizobium oxalatiphilum]